MNLQKKRKKKKKKKHIVVVFVLWSTELCQTKYLLFPRHSGKGLGIVFLQRWIKKIVIYCGMFSWVITKRRAVWKLWKERLQACFLLILLAYHPHRKSCTSQNKPPDQSKSSYILCPDPKGYPNCHNRGHKPSNYTWKVSWWSNAVAECRD